jgi:hypothetical protein
MRLGSWNYKDQDKTKFRHYGPMAQEFYKNFGNDGIGIIGNDTTIATADMDGVLMIAIQALNNEKDQLKQKAKEQETTIKAMQQREKDLVARLEKLEAVILKNSSVEP